MLLLLILALSLCTSTAFAATSNQNTKISQVETTSTSKMAAGSASSSEITFTRDQILDASYRVKNFITNNDRLPNYVTIKTSKVTMPQFTYIMAQTLVNINSGSSSAVALKKVNNPSSTTTETVMSGEIYKSEYLSIAKNILSTINSTGKAPSYKDTTLGKMNYQTLIYTYSNILTYYKTNGKLPNYITVKTWETITNSVGTVQISLGEGRISELTGTAGLQTLANYISKHFNHQYGAATTAAGVEKTGLGDCWGLSAWSAQVLHNNGYTVRIVQGSSSEASNHRWVEVLINGEWKRFDPSLVTRHYGLPYYYACATRTSIIATYT